MKHEELPRLEGLLRKVPEGGLAVTRHSTSKEDHVLLTDQFLVKTAGKGKVDTYAAYPGIEAAYTILF